MPKINPKDWIDLPGDEFFIDSKVRGTQNLQEYDEELIERIAGFGCTYKEIAALCGISEQRFLRMRKKYPAIEEAISRGRAQLHKKLRIKQIEVALDGNPQMLIFLGKAMLEQSDKVEINHNVKAEVEYEVTFGDPTGTDKATEAASSSDDSGE